MFPEAELHVCPGAPLPHASALSQPAHPPNPERPGRHDGRVEFGRGGASVQSNLLRTSPTIRQLSRNRGVRSKETQNLSENRNRKEEKDNSANSKRDG